MATMNNDGVSIEGSNTGASGRLDRHLTGRAVDVLQRGGVPSRARKVCSFDVLAFGELPSVIVAGRDDFEKYFHLENGVVPKILRRGIPAAMAGEATLAAMRAIVARFPAGTRLDWHYMLYLMFTDEPWRLREVPDDELYFIDCDSDYQGGYLAGYGRVEAIAIGEAFKPRLGTSRRRVDDMVIPRFEPIAPDLVCMMRASLSFDETHHALSHRDSHTRWGHICLYPRGARVTVNMTAGVPAFTFNPAVVQVVDEMLRLINWMVRAHQIAQLPLSAGLMRLWCDVHNDSSSSTRFADIAALREVLFFMLRPQLAADGDRTAMPFRGAGVLPWADLAGVDSKDGFAWLSEQFLLRMAAWQERQSDFEMRAAASVSNYSCHFAYNFSMVHPDFRPHVHCGSDAPRVDSRLPGPPVPVAAPAPPAPAPIDPMRRVRNKSGTNWKQRTPLPTPPSPKPRPQPTPL